MRRISSSRLVTSAAALAISRIHRVLPARHMRADVEVRECRVVGLLLRGLARLAREDQHFAYCDKQCCNENDKSVAIHT